MNYYKILKYISSFLFIFLLTRCNNGSRSLDDNLYLADIKYDLNSFLKEYSKSNINKYYLEDSLRGRDSIMDIKFHYASLLYFKQKTIDSLYSMLPDILWGSLDIGHVDTMIYFNSGNLIKSDAKVEQKIKNELLTQINILGNIQSQLVSIRKEMEELRPGRKDEKIDCQNCKFINSNIGILKANRMSEMYFEIENQYVIIYRELACVTFALELIDVRKTATKNYKIRI